MNLKEIKEIINLMNENELTEIELERDGMKVKIKKASNETSTPIIRQPISYHVESQASPAKEETPTPAAKTNLQEIKSPMVGTFYRSPSPEAPPFIEAGQTVEIGQVVCIVEAMKLMNEIKSEVKGKIVELHVDNAQPVEFGQTLFSVEPA